MTKEVAEKIARGIKDKIECNTVDIDDWAEFWGFTREEYEEFLDMAIKALEFDLDKHDEEVIKNTVESIWVEPCEDCISREALRNLICQHNDKYGYSDRFHEFTERCLQLPSVTSKFTDDEIQKIQELEQAQLVKAYELGKTLATPIKEKGGVYH